MNPDFIEIELSLEDYKKVMNLDEFDIERKILKTSACQYIRISLRPTYIDKIEMTKQDLIKFLSDWDSGFYEKNRIRAEKLVDFIFQYHHQPERSKREDPQKGMRCSELNSNIERLAEMTSPPDIR